MSECKFCPVEKDCGYEFKPTDCVQQRKFKTIDAYKQQDEIQKSLRSISGVIATAKNEDPTFFNELKTLLRTST